MQYVVEARKKDILGNVTEEQFRLFDKKTANSTFKREVLSAKWDAVYMEKLYADGKLIDIKGWYK